MNESMKRMKANVSHNLQSSGVGQHYSKGGPTDPPSRSKHKGFQKISRKKTRVPGVRESVRAEPAGRGHSGRTPGAPKTHKVRKHKTGEKSEEPKTLKKTRSPPGGVTPPGLAKSTLKLFSHAQPHSHNIITLGRHSAVTAEGLSLMYCSQLVHTTRPYSKNAALKTQAQAFTQGRRPRANESHSGTTKEERPNLNQ